MLPLVLNEHQVHLFNFYLDGEIHLGMRHGISLFGLVNTFVASQRSEAYQCANKMAQAGRSISITVSRQHYRVWVRLTASESLPNSGFIGAIAAPSRESSH